MKLPIDPQTVKGFLDPQEGRALYEAARRCAAAGPCLEIGSYCGLSTLYLGAGCKAQGGILFALDHHQGSEEHQPGEEWHDPELADPEGRGVWTFSAFRRTLRAAQLEETVVPVVAPSRIAARGWATPLAMLFIDGGHSSQAARDDYRLWTPFLIPGGTLAIHDVFPDPAQGGRPPFEIYRQALASGRFRETGAVKSLRLLARAPNRRGPQKSPAPD